MTTTKSTATIRNAVDDALNDLQALPLHDEAAVAARHAVNLTRHTLECFWIPALDALSGHGSYDDV